MVPLAICLISDFAVQNFADFSKHFSRDILILPELGDNVGAESSCDAQVFFLHIAVDQQFPKLFIANRHKDTSEVDNTE